MKRSILYVDPDGDAREEMHEEIQATEDLTVRTASDIKTAFDLLEDHDFDVVISEATMDPEEVTQLFERARKRNRPVPAIIFTDKDITALMDEGLLLQASAFASKDDEDAVEELVEDIEETVRPRSEVDYPVPEDEEKRLKAANELDLQRLRERDAFDRLTELARAFFDVRYAFVGIVREEDEQFISFTGADVEDLRRECSICTFGILDKGSTVIEHRSRDERFKYIDELDELEIEFYAGSPLVSEEGYRIGMFCLMDDEPRTFSAEERQYLKLFADEASEFIRLYQGDG